MLVISFLNLFYFLTHIFKIDNLFIFWKILFSISFKPISHWVTGIHPTYFKGLFLASKSHWEEGFGKPLNPKFFKAHLLGPKGKFSPPLLAPKGVPKPKYPPKGETFSHFLGVKNPPGGKNPLNL